MTNLFTCLSDLCNSSKCHSTRTLAMTIGSPSVDRRGTKHITCFVVAILLTIGVGQMWGTTLFHETFGDNSSSARTWSNTYSVKSGVSGVYSGASMTVTNAKQSKNTVGSTKSGLTVASNTTGTYIIGPLNVSKFNTFVVTYKWKASSVSKTYWTKLYYKTSSGGSYTEVSGTGAGATTYVTRTYSLPAAAQTSTLYLKVEWLTSNTDSQIDEFDLDGKCSVTYNGNGNTGGSVPTDATKYDINASVTVKSNSGSLVKTGYTFDGWNTKADGTGADKAASATFTITQDTTLYAKWTAAVSCDAPSAPGNSSVS